MEEARAQSKVPEGAGGQDIVAVGTWHWLEDEAHYPNCMQMEY